ncbi:MAG: arginyltransferase, partial [Chromatiaceae bacterium]|nr:arginyltransferase [Chromatiaceae bacterium]
MNQTPLQVREHLALYLTGEHPCSYLAEQRARTLFVDPSARLDGAAYEALLAQGFRRSGPHIYRPACAHCAACVPVRLPVARFSPDRSQRRNWRENAGRIRILATDARQDASHFRLYCSYLDARHTDGAMAEEASEENYRRFLVESWGGETLFIELRLDERLVGVAVTDRLPHSLSAVYTFFDPALERAGLGTFSILAQIDLARHLGLNYLYLGYWIGACRKMAYKARFRPIEAWNG